MKVNSINRLFEIHIEEMDVWKRLPHKNNFFEIVYIDEGEGRQCINQHEFDYKKGNIFLLPPLDCHFFKIANPSRFYFIRFTDQYFIHKNDLTNNDWFNKISYVLANYNKVPGDIISSEKERKFIINNVKYLYHEYLLSDTYSDLIITGIVTSILNILARSIEKKYVDKGNEIDSKFGEILRWIHTNLTNSEQLRITSIAENFGISKSYFSEYFKKHAGISFADYILKSKLRIVETKASHTDLSLKEIAFQLNFTDSSHLANSFKKVYGQTIGEFRKQRSMNCL